MIQKSPFLKKKKHQEVLAKLDPLMESVRKAMCDPDANNVAFHKFFTQSKLTALRKKRQALKDVIARLTEHMKCNEEAAPGSESNAALVKCCDAATTLVQNAKYQTIKWGIVAFLLNKEIANPTKAGGDLRTKLREIWTLHCGDESFKKSMGESVKEIEILIDKKFKAAEDRGGSVDAE